LEYSFYYISLIVILIIFLVCTKFRKVTLSNIIIGLVTIGYSLISDIITGDRLKLFHYISPRVSTLYMIISAVFLYSLLNILYTMFLPRTNLSALLYTAIWVIGLLIFEGLSVKTGTVVFTGWRMFPWSVMLYLVTYLWIYYFYRYLKRRVM
jgi:hypothetical protein